MRIVVAGLAATYPLGGVFWDYLQYAQGLTDLGHEVLYFEDTGAWCYDPAAGTMVKSGASSAVWLGRQIERRLPAQRDRWFYRDAQGETYGASASYVNAFCQTADLFLNVSGAAKLRPNRLPRARTVYIDSDPMYSQANVPDALAGAIKPRARKRLEIMQSYDATFSFGENIGRADCLVPAELFDWRPTRQPVAVDTITSYATPIRDRQRTLTTVGTWEVYKKPILVAGHRYYGKRNEFLRFSDLPRQSSLPVALALSGKGPAEALIASGWSIIDPAPISSSAGGYLRFLASSFAEWSVAKHAYVASNSGWFSGRTALYLALGVPAIVQDTGFSRFLPAGEGLLSFSTPEEAVAAIEDVASRYERHCHTAREIAREFFDAKQVLSRLIDDAFSDTRPAAARNRTAMGS